MNCIIELKDVTKRFPGVVANNGISLRIEKGEIHTLAGENGAGKTTLMNILYGLIQPDEGEILIEGKPVKFRSSKDSIAHKIGMVHQHFLLVPKLTVAENIVAGREIGSPLRLDRKKAEQDILLLSQKYGLKIDPSEKVSNLSITQQQRVEILKILYREAEILIFDEPTSVLTPQEIDELCNILLALREAGKTILFISHKLAEVMKISDRITVIRLGEVIGTVTKNDTNTQELTRMMVGRDVRLGRRDREACKDQSPRLQLSGVSYVVNKTVRKLDNIDLTLYAGEILGVAGVDGNGQEELTQVICGLSNPTSGQVRLNGSDITCATVRARKEQGVALIPEDRQQDGLVMDFSVAENLILGRHYTQPFAKNGLLQAPLIEQTAQEMRVQFDIRTANTGTLAGTLSGGNQQKVVIAREASCAPCVFVAVQPTRGLDIGASEFVHTVLLEQRSKGCGVMLFSLELDEILALSDRIAVMYRGRIVAVVDARRITKQQLGMMMLSGEPVLEGECIDESAE